MIEKFWTVNTDLDPLEGTEGSGSSVAVAGVSVPLAPGHVVEGHRAGVGGLDGVVEGDDVRQDVVVDVAGSEAWSLGLIL